MFAGIIQCGYNSSGWSEHELLLQCRWCLCVFCVEGEGGTMGIHTVGTEKMDANKPGPLFRCLGYDCQAPEPEPIQSSFAEHGRTFKEPFSSCAA